MVYCHIGNLVYSALELVYALAVLLIWSILLMSILIS